VSDGYDWPDIDWRMPRIIPPRAVEVHLPVLDRRPELADVAGAAGAFLAVSARWVA
jgi:hypothetical protein